VASFGGCTLIVEPKAGCYRRLETACVGAVDAITRKTPVRSRSRRDAATTAKFVNCIVGGVIRADAEEDEAAANAAAAAATLTTR